MSIKYRGFSDLVRKNLELNDEEFRAHKVILESYPIKIYVEPTQKCNLKCITCYPGRRTEKNDMPMDLFKQIEQQLFGHVAEVDFFLTGEPLLAKNFEKMMQTSSQYTFLPKIFTNGTFLPENIADLLVRLGFFVNISFDAPVKSSFEKIRVGADFDAIIKNIKKLNSLQQKLGSERFHLRLASTLGTYNIKEAPKIIEFGAELGIKDIMFGSVDGAPKWSLAYDVETSIYYLKKSKEIADKNKIRFSCPKRVGNRIIKENNNWNDFSLPVDKYAPLELESFNPYNGDCGYPWIESAIRANSLVVSCCQREHPMGDLNHHSFQEIWNNERYQQLRSQKLFYRCLGEKCNMAVYSIWNGAARRF